METNFGKGAIPSIQDERDFDYDVLGMATIEFDWEKGYDVEEVIGKKLIPKDQNGSGSCGGQAWSYFGQVLDPDKKEKSAKFIYAQTFQLPSGSFGRDNCKVVSDKGWGDEEFTKSYENGLPPSEAFMQRPQDISKDAFIIASSDKAVSYARVNANIETIAQAIRDNKGAVLGICGQNNGTWLSEFPKPPQQTEWRHWVYVGKAKLINGKKYIGLINSWGKNVGKDGWQWIGEEYMNWLFENWTLVYGTPEIKITKTLKFGMTGFEVKQLQKLLGLKEDGIFGRITLSKVKEFQKQNGLIADGIVGKLTLAKLIK